MTTATKITLGVSAFVLFIIVSVIGTYFSVYNTAVSNEAGIQAQFTDNQNVYDNFAKRVIEIAKVPREYQAAVKDTVKAAIEGRYGDGGSKAVFQFIQEQNPTIDPALYMKLAQVIDAGRMDFAQSQRQLIDRVRVYKTLLNRPISGAFARYAGFPRIDVKDYERIVTSEATEKVFADRKSEPLEF